MSNLHSSDSGNLGDASRDELLAAYAIGDLTDWEQEQVAPLLADPGAMSTLAELQTVAAAIDLAFTGIPREELPQSLRTKIRQNWRRQNESAASDERGSSKFGANATDGSFNSPGTSGSALLQEQPSALDDKHDIAGQQVSLAQQPGAASASGKLSLRETLAWLCCAASLLIAGGLWYGSSTGRSSSAEQQVGVVPRSAEEARAALLEQASDSIQIAWSPGKTPFDDPIEGDVVWSNEQQAGFMRFSGMPENDPSSEQYQLWIIDPQRDEEPIDGGVFDVDSSGEVVIPINAKLPVIAPQAFAITIEKPGGVVVSTQDRLPLIAAVE